MSRGANGCGLSAFAPLADLDRKNPHPGGFGCGYG